MKLHWRPVPHPPPSSLWTSLPPVNLDKTKVESLFTIHAKLKSNSGSDRFSRPKEILVLDPKRSNQINIGIRGLPPVSSLKELIEKMDDTTISRAGVEKLQNLIPGEEELAQIKEAAKDADEDMPLGTAEQFLLMMSSIPGLECRLKLWAFKVDFKAMERDICEPLVALREGMKAVKSSDTFAALMAVVLAMGNTLNRSKISGFQLDYLSKLSWVKDTSSKHSLLHHVTQVLMSEKADMADLSKEFSSLATVARTDYELLGSNLAGMEEECKTSLGYLRLSFVYQPETRNLVSSFLTDAAERILSMQKVSALVAEEYTRFLTWLGLPTHLHRDYPAARVAGLLVETAREVGKASEKLARDKAREAKKTKAMSLPRRTRKVKEEFGTTAAVSKDSKRSSLPSKSLIKKDSTESLEADDGGSLEAYLEEAAGMVVPHRANRRRSGGKIRNSASTM